MEFHKSLAESSDSPSLDLVRKFAGCLQEEENEVTDNYISANEDSKGRVWQLRVSNQQLDENLRDLDTKIGLLIKNRINLQEVIAQKDKIADETDSFLLRPGSIRKKVRDQHANLEHLFYHLQADPEYLANLVQSDERKEIDGFSLLTDCIAPTFGFVTEKRENYLLTNSLVPIVFCLYALATLLFRLRKGPPMRNLTGKAAFTQQELDDMKIHLKDLNLPQFGNVDSLLSGMSSDEKAQLEAVKAINEAILKEDESVLMSSLQHPDAGILHVEKELGRQYLLQLKREREREENNLLEKKRIQETVIETNNSHALSQLHYLLDEEEVNSKELIRILDILQFEETRELAVCLYISLLKKARQSHLGQPLTRSQVHDVIQGESVGALRYNYEKSPETFFLSKTDLQNILYEFDDISTEHRTLMELSVACTSKDTVTVETMLRQLCGTVYMEDNIEYYIRHLSKNSPTSVENLKEQLEFCNKEVQKAFADCEDLVRLNSSLKTGNRAAARVQLLGVTASLGCEEYRRERTHWYVNALVDEAEKRNKDTQTTTEWFEHRFLLGSVWIEVEEHTRSTKIPVRIIENKVDENGENSVEPKENKYIQWDEIKDIIANENVKFDAHYAENEDQVRRAQEQIRRFIQHKKNRIALHQEQERQLAAKTIQQNYKKYKARKDEEEFKSSDSPSLDLVRKCAGCLQEEENEVTDQLANEDSKGRVWQLRVSNQQLDENLRDLDTKIGLLIKNRINLQEVIAQKDKIADETDSFLLRPGSIRKKVRDQHANLEHLFYHLQADPEYLANLVQSDERKEIDGFSLLTDCIAPTFGFVTEKRENYLLVRLLCELLLRVVEKSTKPEEVLQQKKTVNFIRQIICSHLLCSQKGADPCFSISAQLRTFLSDDVMNSATVFNLDPLDIYRSVYSKAPESIDVAVADENVQKVLEASKDFLALWSETFADALIQNHRLTNTSLYLALYLQEILRRQFPTSKEIELQRIVAEFVFEICLRGFLLSSSAFMSSTSRKDLAEDACHKLESVVQFMGYAIANRGYGNSKWFLTSLNKQIHTIHEHFRSYVVSQTSTVRLDDLFGMNEFTHFDPSNKPTLTIMDKHLTPLLKYLKNNAPVLVPGTNSSLHNLLQSSSAPDAKKNSEEKTITLYLHPVGGAEEDQQNVQQLFVRMKKYVIDLLLSGVDGSSVSELMTAELTEEQEEIHKEKYIQENITLAQKQKDLSSGLTELTTFGRVIPEDEYQAIVTDIANDIRLATRRRLERAEQRKSLADAEKTLLSQREELKVRLMQYEEYLDTCLENLSRTSRRLSFRPDTKSAGKIQKQRMSLDVPKNYKNSVDKMFRKGVLVDVKVAGYEQAKKMAKLTLDISSSDKRGIYRIQLLDGKEMILSCSIDFQELLQNESNEQQKFPIADGALVLDVPRTIQYINKKFYSK